MGRRLSRAVHTAPRRTTCVLDAARACPAALGPARGIAGSRYPATARARFASRSARSACSASAAPARRRAERLERHSSSDRLQPALVGVQVIAGEGQAHGERHEGKTVSSTDGCVGIAHHQDQPTGELSC